MRYFFGICKQKRKILTFMCSPFSSFPSSQSILAARHMHHISYRGGKNIFNLFFVDIFFRCFVASTAAQISLLMVITIHYKFRSFSCSIAKKSEKIANSFVHISSSHFFCGLLIFFGYFFLSGSGK
jgi:hypothetical protein